MPESLPEQWLVGLDYTDMRKQSRSSGICMNTTPYSTTHTQPNPDIVCEARFLTVAVGHVIPLYLYLNEPGRSGITLLIKVSVESARSLTKRSLSKSMFAPVVTATKVWSRTPSV